ncbi:MAG: hypothetical protein HON90_15440, partial [Halobacteriovoraceae bacterium]|nr:hypothetical protein [Halobacteriovoraceae bacterium]
TEKQKLESVMERELGDLKAHRLQISNADAERYKALNYFESVVKNENALHDRYDLKKYLFEKFKYTPKKFNEYVSKVRQNFSQMEINFSDHWRQWNKDLGIESNEIQDWKVWEAELEGKNYYERNPHPNPDKERIGLGQNKSVYDYLASMQLFMKDHGIPVGIGMKDLSAMKLNNYTQNPAAPFIDLDLYRNNSGLKRRSFIGPCTLIENQNMSEMRPTDTIDEKYCDRIDCSENLIKFGFQVDNKVFEESAYHGAIKPFAMLHVDNVIELYKEHERDYYDSMRAQSQLGTFLKNYNMDYVSLGLRKEFTKPQHFKDRCLVDRKEGDYSSEAFDKCYERTDDNVISLAQFRNRVKRAGIKSLLKEFFTYKYLDSDVESREARTNNLQSNIEQLKEEALGTSVEVQEELTGTNLGDLIRGAFKSDLNVTKYLTKFEDNKLEDFDAKALRQLIHPKQTKDHKLKLIEAVKLCGLLSEGITAQLIGKKLIKEAMDNPIARDLDRERARKRNFQEKLYNTNKNLIRKNCLKSIEFDPETGEVHSPHLSFDRRYRVIETGTYEHIEGKNLNINVGYGFEISDGQSNTVSSAFSGSLSVGVPVSIVSGSITAAKEVAQTDVQAIVRASSVSSATFLVVQQATMEIELRKYEKCFTSHLMPSLFYDISADDLELIEGKEIIDSDVAQILSKGIMVCDGKITNKPIKVIENYYYVTQHFTAGDILDDGNLLNHIFLLPLRGTRDFNNFMRIMNAKRINSKGEVISDNDRFLYPNLRLMYNYGQISPSYPAMYTVQGRK